jgi:hypothetical protein
MICSKVYVTGVSSGHRVRCYNLISLVSRRAKRPCGFLGAHPLTTLKAFSVGNDLPYSATASAWAEHRREELQRNVRVYCMWYRAFHSRVQTPK